MITLLITDKWILSSLIDVPKKNLLEEAPIDEEVLDRFKTHSTVKTNGLFYTGAVIVTNELRLKRNRRAGRKEPTWRKRIEVAERELLWYIQPDPSENKIKNNKLIQN